MVQDVTAHQIGERFAAFAVGCLGAKSPAKAGEKLGLMGSASEEEISHVLRHLEVLALQRAAKIAGVGVGNETVELGQGSTCSATFEQALREALKGSGTQDVIANQEGQVCGELFRHLPHDARGRADLLRVFGMITALPNSACGAEHLGGYPDTSKPDAFSFSAEYADNAIELPSASCSDRIAAQRHLVELEDPSEARWESATSALNAIRASLAHASTADVDSETAQVPQEALLEAIARCCVSRRPALAKTSLRAILELVEAIPAASGLTCEAWKNGLEAILTGCFGALKATKAAGKIAEAAIAAVLLRVTSDATAEVAVKSLAQCISTIAKSRPPQPLVVAAGLRALSPLMPSLSVETGVLDEVTTLCKEVLDSRGLSPAFSEARAIQRAAQQHGVTNGSRSAATDA